MKLCPIPNRETPVFGRKPFDRKGKYVVSNTLIPEIFIRRMLGSKYTRFFADCDCQQWAVSLLMKQLVIYVHVPYDPNVSSFDERVHKLFL